MAVTAWLRSLPIVIGGPMALWCILSFIGWISSGEAGSMIGYAGVAIFAILASAPVHLLGYALFGLPLFLLGYSRVGAFIWNPLVCSLFGLLLGSMLAVSGMVGVQGMPDIQNDLMGYMAMFGVCYGIWTSAWARRFRPVASSSNSHSPMRCRCRWVLGN